MTTNYRIGEARERAHLTQQELAAKVGISQQAIQYYESGERDVKSSMVIKLSNALGCSPTYLLGLESSPWLEETHKANSGEYVEVPVYGSIAAGTPIDMMETDDSFPVPARIVNAHPNCFMLHVEGESMSRLVPNRWLALIDPEDREPNERDAFAVCINGYKATLKHIKQLSNGFELIPDSYDPTYRAQIFDYGEDDTDEITIIGKMVWAAMPFDYEI